MSVQFPANRDVEAWQVAVWNAADSFLSRPQRLVLMQMLDASFNEYDGFRVVRDLIDHRSLWQTVLMCRGYAEKGGDPNRPWWHLHSDLIPLRDLEGYWNVDTVFVLHDKAHTAALTQLAGHWSADEVRAVDEEAVGPLLGSYGPDPPAILHVWWD